MKYFCAAPFITTYAWPNGDVSPCCVINNADMGNINDTPLDEIINHPKYKELRSNMLNDIPSEMCNKCYVEEEATGVSTRTFFDKIDLDGQSIDLDETITDFRMYHWDIRFSNLCNFKCRMCGPLSSTKWYEDQELADDDHDYKKTEISINDVDQFFEDNLHNLKYLRSIYFAGGEPLIQPQQYQFLDKLIEHGITDVQLHYQTNGSFLEYGKHDIFDYLHQFKKVSVSISLDGTKDVAEYIRTGINWRTTTKNLKKYITERSKNELHMNFVVSALNVLNVVDFFDTMDSYDIVFTNNISINQVTEPRYLRPSVLPEEIRLKAKDKILQSKWFVKYPEKFQMVLDLLDINTDEDFPTFVEKTKAMDKKRNTDVAHIIPELTEYFNKRELMNVTETRLFDVYYNDDFVFVGSHEKTIEEYFKQYKNIQQLVLDVDKSVPHTPPTKDELKEYGFDVEDRAVITVIENPYKALVDFYTRMQTYTHKPLDTYAAASEFAKELSFEEWATKFYSTGVDKVISKITDDADYVIRMEYLDFDLKNLCHRLGFEYFEEFSLPKNEGLHYSRFYNTSTTEIIKDYYSSVITAFNYKMEPPSTLCVTAESSLRTLTDSSCQICCMNTRTLTDDSGNRYSVETHSIDEIWNSNSRKEVITDLRNGIQHPSCKKCWDEEDAGLESRRIRDNKYNGVTPAENFDHPTLYEFNLGTVCNIKCRTCGPWSSSKWLDEYFNSGLAEIDRVNSSGSEWDAGKMGKFREIIEGYSKSYRDDSRFWDDIKSHIHEAQHLDFYGGEPFLVKNQWKLLEYAIENDYAKNISIHYNTNGTLWDQKKVKILDSFKEVKIDFSIDGMEKHFEYTRHPAKWNKVKKNLLEAVELYGKNVAICHTVSALNMYYVDEILLWAEQNGVQIYLNLVHGPEWYNIKNIPESVKEVITAKLKDNINNNMSGWFSLNGIIEFMNGTKADPNAWEKFKTITLKVDNNRNESFKDTFPEYYEIIKEKGEW